MSRMTFVAGAVLTASQVNTYLMKQAVDVCTSSTRPSSPSEGQVIYETDTDKLFVYASATAGVQWKAPWNLPWGEVSSSRQSSTALSTNVTAGVDVFTTGSITIPANRRILVCGNLTLSDTVAGDETRVTVAVDSTVLQIDQQLSGAAKAVTHKPVGTWVSDGSAHTFKLSAVRQSGTGTVSIASGATFPAELWLVDLGPTAAPA